MTDERSENKDRVEDLDVPETESDDVKGGLPAVQKVREAAGRSQQAGQGGGIEIDSYSWGPIK
jgi:hypothetical protein